jgi:ElaB/YqjD/DUF883 family membrane-anchored ribosome-binding protein
MSNANNPNASGSTGTTSPGGPGKPQQWPPPPHPQALENRVDRKVNEADYLTRQADEARAALTAVVADMKQALADGANVKEWTRQHPWILTSGAAVAGFVAGMLVTPSKESSYKQMWESLKDKLTPETDEPATTAATARTIADQPQAEKPSIVAVVLREVLKAVGPTIGGLITGALAGQPDSPPTQGNGHHPVNGPAEPPGGAPQA